VSGLPEKEAALYLGHSRHLVPEASAGELSRLFTSVGDQDLGMLPCYIDQTQRRTGRLSAPALPACGGHRWDVHHRGENRLADVEHLAD